MRKTPNTLLFEKQLARINRILNKSEHSDLTIQKPKRVTKPFLARLGKIKPKNINLVIESGDFTFISRDTKSFGRLVNQTKNNRSKAKASTSHLSASKTKPTSDLSSRYKALKKTQSTSQSSKHKGEEESKKASPSLFGGDRNDDFADMLGGFEDDVSREFQHEDFNGQEFKSSVDQTDDVNENILSTMIEDEDEFSKLDVARERWEEYSTDAREGSLVTEVINKYISGFGTDIVFANMSNFGSEFWEALDVCHRYETQGMWGGEDDEGAAWAGAGEYAENIDFIINYMAEKFDPWFGSGQMD